MSEIAVKDALRMSMGQGTRGLYAPCQPSPDGRFRVMRQVNVQVTIRGIIQYKTVCCKFLGPDNMGMTPEDVEHLGFNVDRL